MALAVASLWPCCGTQRSASYFHCYQKCSRVFLTLVEITRMLRRMNVGPRHLLDQIVQDWARKMVFVSKPRQVGKTTLTRSVPGEQDGYLS